MLSIKHKSVLVVLAGNTTSVKPCQVKSISQFHLLHAMPLVCGVVCILSPAYIHPQMCKNLKQKVPMVLAQCIASKAGKDGINYSAMSYRLAIKSINIDDHTVGR